MRDFFPIIFRINFIAIATNFRRRFWSPWNSMQYVLLREWIAIVMFFCWFSSMKTTEEEWSVPPKSRFRFVFAGNRVKIRCYRLSHLVDRIGFVWILPRSDFRFKGPSNVSQTHHLTKTLHLNNQNISRSDFFNNLFYSEFHQNKIRKPNPDPIKSQDIFGCVNESD